MIDSKKVNKMHAKLLVANGGGVMVADLKSVNGTWMNGERLAVNKYVMLRDGDVLAFADYNITYVFKRFQGTSDLHESGISKRTRSRSNSMEKANPSKSHANSSSKKLFDSFTGDSNSKAKFMKLMGVKSDSINLDEGNKQEKKKMEVVTECLTKQFENSIKRKAKRTRGLGF